MWYVQLCNCSTWNISYHLISYSKFAHILPGTISRTNADPKNFWKLQSREQRFSVNILLKLLKGISILCEWKKLSVHFSLNVLFHVEHLISITHIMDVYLIDNISYPDLNNQTWEIINREFLFFQVEQLYITHTIAHSFIYS